MRCWGSPEEDIRNAFEERDLVPYRILVVPVSYNEERGVTITDTVYIKDLTESGCDDYATRHAKQWADPSTEMFKFRREFARFSEMCMENIKK
jgi:hypothetical protein